MNYYTIPPSEKLKGLVRFFWVFESGEVNKPYIYRSMADSCCELIFHYKGTFEELSENGPKKDTFRSGIHSQSPKFRRFITGEEFGIFGAYLYPFAVVKLLHLSPGELTNLMPDLYSALGKKGKELEEKIMLASDNTSRYQILTEFLESRLLNTSESDHPILSAIKHVIHSGKTHTVRDLASAFNLSERQFHRKFKEYSGLPPKKFIRIARFEDACNYYDKTDHITLTEIAHNCGYYDQSHFIHDFKAFSGYHPSEFFSGKGEGTEWRES